MPAASDWAASALAVGGRLGLLGLRGQGDLLGLGVPGLALEDLRERLGGREPLVVGLQRRGGALEGGVLVEDALGAVGAHHRVQRGEVAAVLVGLRDQAADPVPLGGDRTTGVGGVRPGLPVGRPGLLEAPHRAVVGLGGLLGAQVGLVEPLVGQQQPALDGADVVRGALGAGLGPVDLVLARVGARCRAPAPPPGSPEAIGTAADPEAHREGEGQRHGGHGGGQAQSSHRSNLSSAPRAASLRFAGLCRRRAVTGPRCVHPSGDCRRNASAHQPQREQFPQ